MRNVQFMSITVESTSIGQVPRKFLRTIVEVPVVVLHLAVVSRCSEKFTALPVRGKVRTSHKEGNVTMACITSLNVTRNRSERRYVAGNGRTRVMKLHLFGSCPDWEIGAQATEARQRGENTLQMPDRFFVKLPDSFLPRRAMAHIFKSPHLRLFPLSFDLDARKDSN